MSTTAKAAVLVKIGGDLEIESVEVRDPGPNDVTVRIKCSGICHSDESGRIGASPALMPAVLGHEGAGVVEAVGAAVRDIAVGDTVICVATPSCGQCRTCMTGNPVLCERSAEIEDRTQSVGRDHTFFHLLGLGTLSQVTTL